jgi:molybdopterin-guanine dinucleotide biosynthesis protein A
MGTPKAELVVDGAPMAVRVADAARAAGAAAVAAVGSPVPGTEHLVEDEPGAGPLGAVLAALRWAGGDDVLVLSCDLLTPAAVAMRALVDELRSDPDVDVAVPVAGGRTQWLHGAWRSSPETVAAVRVAYEAGERSVRGAARTLRVRSVEVPDAAPYAHADRPEDLPPGARPGSGTGPGAG